MAVHKQNRIHLGFAIIFCCFFSLAFSKPKTYNSWIDRPQSDASTANFFKLFNTKFRLLERKIDVEFRILGQTLREELRGIGSQGGGCPPNGGGSDKDTTQALTRLKFEVQTLQMDIKQMASDQKRFEERIVMVINNGTEGLVQRLNGIEVVLQNATDSVKDFSKAIEILLDKVDGITDPPSPEPTTLESTTPMPSPSKYI